MKKIGKTKDEGEEFIMKKIANRIEKYNKLIQKSNLKKEKNRGITLIALVITIIVLLILAGVSIGMLTGQNGILTQAQNAKQKTEEGKIKEQNELAKANATMNIEKQTYVDKNEESVVVPEGFSVIEIDGENTVKDGLVITDKNGNEFVWIPCSEEEYKEADSNWLKSSTYEGRTWSDIQSTEIGLSSVKKYGGFYIARYESGIPEDATDIYAGTKDNEYAQKRMNRNDSNYIEKYTPVSQKGKEVWNTVTQKKAKILSEKMVNNTSANSYLVDSYAWNAMCRIIEKKTNISIKDSTKFGNYYNNTTTAYEKINTKYAIFKYGSQGVTNFDTLTMKSGYVLEAPKGKGENRIELATGSSDNFKTYNIYDVAGNVWEWTTELSTDLNAVLRGGSFQNNGEERPMEYINGNDSSTSKYGYNVGFRAVMYLK